MNAEIIKTEIIRRMDEGEEKRMANAAAIFGQDASVSNFARSISMTGGGITTKRVSVIIDNDASVSQVAKVISSVGKDIIRKRASINKVV